MCDYVCFFIDKEFTYCYEGVRRACGRFHIGCAKPKSNVSTIEVGEASTHFFRFPTGLQFATGGHVEQDGLLLMSSRYDESMKNLMRFGAWSSSRYL